MIKLLKKIGNSHGIIIDRSILDLLGIDPNTPLEMTTERGGLFLRPVRAPCDQKEGVFRSTARMAEIHRDSLRKIAE